jgi:sugar phosphate isomerase/epimerase
MFRRQAIQILSASILANNVLFNSKESALGSPSHPYPNEPLGSDATPRHLLATSLFGTEKLESILPIAEQLGIEHIDLWPKIHGSQREELTEMGEDRFADLLAKHKVKLGCITQFPLGPFGLADEIRLCNRLHCPTIVTGSGGTAGLQGQELKRAVEAFIEKMKPHWELAREHQVTIAIENHGKSLLDSPDSLRWFHEYRMKHAAGAPESLAIAFAPYHLPQNEELLVNLLTEILPSTALFYAWQHGKGCMQAQPKEDELLQLPGKGPLDFKPLLKALRDGNFQGWTEIFMHPFPRGIPIHSDLKKVTEEIRSAQSYIHDNW